MSEVMKAIQLSQMENELIDVRRQIKKIEGIVNSINVRWKSKKVSKSLLPELVKRREELVDFITEAALL